MFPVRGERKEEGEGSPHISIHLFCTFGMLGAYKDRHLDIPDGGGGGEAWVVAGATSIGVGQKVVGALCSSRGRDQPEYAPVSHFQTHIHMVR